MEKEKENGEEVEGKGEGEGGKEREKEERKQEVRGMGHLPHHRARGRALAALTHLEQSPVAKPSFCPPHPPSTLYKTFRTCKGRRHMTSKSGAA